MNACQSPTTAYPGSGTPVWKRRALATIYGAITRWIGCLARSSCACRDVWSAAAMLPRQPCLRSGTCQVVDPADHVNAGGARHNHGAMNEIPSCRCFLKQVLVSLMVKSDTVVQRHTISSQKHRGVLYQSWWAEGHDVRSDNAPPLSVDVPNQRSRATQWHVV